jgi:transposase
VSIHDLSDAVVVAVDVGKNVFAVSATDGHRKKLVGPLEVPMTRRGLEGAVARIGEVLPAMAPVWVGIEAAGHYHLPLLADSCWPEGWQLLQLNPAHVAEQRRIQGRRRIKTDALDLEAITELVLAGRGTPFAGRTDALEELRALAGHRARRIQARTAVKNQLQGQLDRTFPGLSLALADVLGTHVGRLITEHFTDPARLAALGEARFIRFAANRGVHVTRPVAARLVAAARDALPQQGAAAARGVLAADLALLDVLEAQAAAAEDALAALLPATPFQILSTVPGWGTVRAANYGAALGDPSRWPGAAQVYRASGLSPAQYESAGRRRDGTISREGSVPLRRALVDLGLGLWLNEPAAKAYGAALRVRGKKGKVIVCAMAHRANRIAYALVRDQAPYDPARWPLQEA